MVDLRKELDRIKSTIDSIFQEAIRELEESREVIFELHGRYRFRRLYRRLERIIDRLEDELLEIRKKLREIENKAREVDDREALKTIEEIEEVVKEKVREFTERYDKVLEKIREKWTERGPPWSTIIHLPHRLGVIISRGVGEALRTVAEDIKETAESISTVVSSIRLREDDMKIIDELVEAGIFKSRSEAVAYFTHKGIEASKEWLQKIREHVEKIRELQDEIRRELKRE